MGRILDRFEAVIEWLIRASGWSAIFFVLCIFVFIFKEGGPFLWNELVYSTGDRELEGGSGAAAESLPAIVFEELPYEVPEDTFVEELKEAGAGGKITGFRDVTIESGEDESGNARVEYVVYLEPGADPEAAFGQIQEIYPLRQDRSHVREFFTSEKWRPTSLKRRFFGIVTLLAGTFSVTALAILLAVPFSLGAAIFISEFCGGKLKEALKILIELLAAIPSVVWGFIGYTILNVVIMQVTGRSSGLNLLNGGLVLALMSAPIIVSLAEDALKAVPDSYREAAAALGASRWQTVYKVLLPAAKNGLLAAVLLGVGRAIGETMAVLMVTGHETNIPDSLFDSVRTMTATIAAEMGEAPQGGGHYRSLFLIGIVLMVITLFVNLTADLIIKGFRGREND